MKLLPYKNPVVGFYFAQIGEGENKISIPIVISNREEDLYNACSPIQEFQSSLTFERGKPVEHDVHGAEETLAAYVRLGTLVAYIPETMEFEKRSADPPWAARMFIHQGEDYRKTVQYIPQPVYTRYYVLIEVLKDAVNWILFVTTDSTGYANCDTRYKGVYVDAETRFSISKWDMDKIKDRWNTKNFILRIK
jgi:hypothetical protein